MQSENDIFKSKVLGHPSALFVLFFTEMWERFSYYGMRALLVIFLTASITDHGWGLEKSQASVLFGSYVALIYLSTMLGGYFADNVWGYRKSVVVGAILMTMGHAAMAFESTWSIYTGLLLLVFGSGFFKPNMTSMISHLYKDHPEKKDGAYTIFYMGVNAGAFFGIGLCGYLGEKVGWSLGFGLAGVFMFFGMLQFWFSQGIFGDVGLKPEKAGKNTDLIDAPISSARIKQDARGRFLESQPFSTWQLAMIFVMAALGLLYIINDPLYKIYDIQLLPYGSTGAYTTVLIGIAMFLGVTIYRLGRYTAEIRNKMIAVIVFAVMVMVFWAIFEQSPNTLTTFARDYTNRSLEGNAALVFKIVNSIITILPLSIITWVLFKLFGQTFKKYGLANVILSISFVIIWTVAIWMLIVEFQKDVAEVGATWFGVLNSLFIIAFAPLFSRWWGSSYNPSATIKFGLGLGFLAIGMACLAFGASGIAPGAKTASVSMVWLVLVYLFHTLGELCISPVGLSYVSKLVPGKMIAFMFGMWYLAVAIGNKIAGIFGEESEKIANDLGIAYFFWILTAIPVVLGIIAIALGPLMRKLMGEVK